MQVSIFEMVLRVLAAAVCGAVIGFEREMKRKPAGFLTFTLVCVGSCLIALLQVNLVNEAVKLAHDNPNIGPVIRTDMGRIIAQVVSGIGFLGAGTIIHNRGGVTGITTAALLWLVSALGLIIGIGGTANYVIAAVTVVLVLPLSYFSRKLGEKISQKRIVHRIRIVFDENFEKIIFDNLARQGIIVRKTYLINKIKKDNINLKESIIYFTLPKTRSFSEVMHQISMLDAVYEIEEA
ncbi:MAG TPA: MgtC/SapB family protein [Bacilli bacterium]|nr:MgtC/SapB family protein [Bacilli bacterium]